MTLDPTDLPVLDHWVGAPPGRGSRPAPSRTPTRPSASRPSTCASARPPTSTTRSRCARAAYETWGVASMAARQQVMFAFRELFTARREELAEILTGEHGKVLSDALGETPAAWRWWSSRAACRSW